MVETSLFPGTFMDPEKLTVRQPLPGITMRIGWGRKMMLSQVTIEPGSEIPEHDHPHEQAGVCLSGRFELRIGATTRTLEAGDMYLIPGGTPHAVRGLDVTAVAVDYFSPIREDYLPEDLVRELRKG